MIQSLLTRITYTSNNTGFTNSQTTQIRSSKLKGRERAAKARHPDRSHR